MQFFLGGVLWISFVLIASHLTKDIQKTPPRKKCVFACLFFSKTMRKPAEKKYRAMFFKHLETTTQKLGNSKQT